MYKEYAKAAKAGGRAKAPTHKKQAVDDEWTKMLGGQTEDHHLRQAEHTISPKSQQKAKASKSAPKATAIKSEPDFKDLVLTATNGRVQMKGSGTSATKKPAAKPGCAPLNCVVPFDAWGAFHGCFPLYTVLSTVYI